MGFFNRSRGKTNAKASKLPATIRAPRHQSVTGIESKKVATLRRHLQNSKNSGVDDPEMQLYHMNRLKNLSSEYVLQAEASKASSTRESDSTDSSAVPTTPAPGGFCMPLHRAFHKDSVTMETISTHEHPDVHGSCHVYDIFSGLCASGVDLTHTIGNGPEILGEEKGPHPLIPHEISFASEGSWEEDHILVGEINEETNPQRKSLLQRMADRMKKREATPPRTRIYVEKPKPKTRVERVPRTTSTVSMLTEFR